MSFFLDKKGPKNQGPQKIAESDAEIPEKQKLAPLSRCSDNLFFWSEFLCLIFIGNFLNGRNKIIIIYNLWKSVESVDWIIQNLKYNPILNYK